MSERVLERIRKVWALANQGEGGEKEAALRILEKMLSDNGMTFDDLLVEEKEKDFKAILNNDFDLRLLGQTYCKVSSAKSMQYYKKGKSVYFWATRAHGIETLSLFSLYKAALKKDLELLFEAFIFKNSIFNNADDGGDEKAKQELTPEEEKELLRIINMMNVVGRVDAHKAIEDHP